MNQVSLKEVSIVFKKNRLKRGKLKHALSGLRRQYSLAPYYALKKVSLDLRDGETLGVVGKNGAGKSTLLRLLAGVYVPDEGSITRAGTISSLLSLGTGFQPSLTGYDNIFLNALLLGLKEPEVFQKIPEIIEFSELGDAIHDPIKTYSSGMATRLGFSIAANIKSDIILIDEVLGVGDKDFKKKSQEKLEQLLGEARSVVIVSHSMEDIRRYCSRVIWLEQGQIIKEGPTEEVIKAYERDQ